MVEGHSYIATTGESRFQTREVIRISAEAQKITSLEPKRIFVPFSGFDGQSLAGKGALVWEGELLELRKH